MNAAISFTSFFGATKNEDVVVFLPSVASCVHSASSPAASDYFKLAQVSDSE